MLVAATNPCACGYAGERELCACSEAELARHRRRLSGPLLDRIDLFAGLGRAGAAAIDAEPLTSSARAGERIAQARSIQAARLRHERVSLNAHMDARMLLGHAAPDEGGAEMLRRAGESGVLSARAQHRVLRVARTIADLAASERVRARDIGAALALRPEAARAGTRGP
jgi:magnesium chelatase family protein